MPFLDLIGHERPTAILKASILHDRVAHAYLFFGEDRIGKRLAALRFAQAINCEIDYGPGGPDACGACRSCRQIEARTHPDFLLIEPDQEQANPQIKIEQIRELEQQLVYHPLVGRRKVCLIDEADRMTPGAANALLKTLEEPPDHSLLLLITSRPSALLATVRSRCHGIRLVAPPRAAADRLLHRDRLPQLEESAHGLRPDALLDLLADIETIQQAATRNVNLQMALETILLRLRDAIKAPTDGHLAR